MIGGLLREVRGPAVVDAAAEETELLYAVAMLAERLDAAVTGQTVVRITVVSVTTLTIFEDLAGQFVTVEAQL